MKAPTTKPLDEVVYSTEADVSCDGTGGALGHPKVFLHIGISGEVTCPYCSRKFILS